MGSLRGACDETAVRVTLEPKYLRENSSTACAAGAAYQAASARPLLGSAILLSLFGYEQPSIDV